MSGKISESRFYMWRAVVAMAHADEVVKPHEIHFVLENTKKLPLTEEQREILMGDIERPADINALFLKITNERDREDFFHLARALAWSDGDFNEQEKDVLRLVGSVSKGMDDGMFKTSERTFREIYIEGKREPEDKTLLSMVRGLLNQA